MNIDDRIKAIETALAQARLIETDLWNELQKVQESFKPLRIKWGGAFAMVEQLQTSLEHYKAVKDVEERH